MPSFFQRVSKRLSNFLICGSPDRGKCESTSKTANHEADYAGKWEPSFVHCQEGDGGQDYLLEWLRDSRDNHESGCSVRGAVCGYWLGFVLPNSTSVLVARNMGDHCERSGHLSFRLVR